MHSLFACPLQVRVIVERLVRRLDYETIASNMPEGDRKLLTHIRKEQQRKQRIRGQSQAEDSQVQSAVACLLQAPSVVQHHNPVVVWQSNQQLSQESVLQSMPSQ